MTLRAVGFLLLPVASFGGFVLLIIPGGAEKEVIVGVKCVYAGRIVAVMQDLDTRGNRTVDQRPNEAVGFP